MIPDDIRYCKRAVKYSEFHWYKGLSTQQVSSTGKRVFQLSNKISVTVWDGNKREYAKQDLAPQC
jgi:hypothetical protein